MVEQNELQRPEEAQQQILHDHKVVEGLRIDKLLAQKQVIAPPDPEDAKVLDHIPEVAVHGGHDVATDEEPRVRITKRIRIVICKRLPESKSTRGEMGRGGSQSLG